MRCIDQRNDLVGKIVLVRAGLNTPMQDGEVADDFRIHRALPTLRFLQEQGAKTIIIAHVGRDESESLLPVADVLNTLLPVGFTTREQLDISKMDDGDMVLLENLRQDPREIANDESFAKELASLADIFVQDAFSVCHREHASIVGIPKHIDSYAGFLLDAEVQVLSSALEPKHPALFVLGGAKFATKEPLIRKFIEVYDTVFVGGALQNEILAAKGNAVGASVIEDGVIAKDILESESVYEVTDVVVEHEDTFSSTVAIDDVRDTDVIVDIGKETIDALIETLPTYKTIVWNGPLGWYEKGFDAATVRLAHAAVECEAEVIVGGGDTVAVIQKEGLEDDFDFVSTGGGAMLKFLQDGTLPGIEVLRD